MERQSHFASVEQAHMLIETLINAIIVLVDVGKLKATNTHWHTQTFGPISHNLKHLRSEETLEGDVNMWTDIFAWKVYEIHYWNLLPYIL